MKGHKGVVLSYAASDAYMCVPLLSKEHLLEKRPEFDSYEKPVFEPGPLVEPKYGRTAEYVDMEAQVLVRHTSDARAAGGLPPLANPAVEGREEQESRAGELQEVVAGDQATEIN